MASDVAREIAGECVGARVRMLNRLVTRIYDDLIRPHGLRFSQMNILTVVSLRGPIPPAQVGRILAIEKSTLSRNLRLMEENGWLQARLRADGHRLELRITPQGRRLLESAAPDWRRAQEQVTAMLGARTAAALRKAVDRVRTGE